MNAMTCIHKGLKMFSLEKKYFEAGIFYAIIHFWFSGYADCWISLLNKFV